MSDEAGSSTPLVQSKLARARAGRGSMLGPTPAAKKLAKPVPFGGVQTLPRRSPDASRSLIQATSRLSRNGGPHGGLWGAPQRGRDGRACGCQPLFFLAREGAEPDAVF